MKEKAYYENVNVKNEVKLRKLPRVPESRMLTISAVFLTISAM